VPAASAAPTSAHQQTRCPSSHLRRYGPGYADTESPWDRLHTPAASRSGSQRLSPLRPWCSTVAAFWLASASEATKLCPFHLAFPILIIGSYRRRLQQPFSRLAAVGLVAAKPRRRPCPVPCPASRWQTSLSPVSNRQQNAPKAQFLCWCTCSSLKLGYTIRLGHKQSRGKLKNCCRTYIMWNRATAISLPTWSLLF